MTGSLGRGLAARRVHKLNRPSLFYAQPPDISTPRSVTTHLETLRIVAMVQGMSQSTSGPPDLAPQTAALLIPPGSPQAEPSWCKTFGNYLRASPED